MGVLMTLLSNSENVVVVFNAAVVSITNVMPGIEFATKYAVATSARLMKRTFKKLIVDRRLTMYNYISTLAFDMLFGALFPQEAQIKLEMPLPIGFTRVISYTSIVELFGQICDGLESNTVPTTFPRIIRTIVESMQLLEEAQYPPNFATNMLVLAREVSLKKEISDERKRSMLAAFDLLKGSYLFFKIVQKARQYPLLFRRS